MLLGANSQLFGGSKLGWQTRQMAVDEVATHPGSSDIAYYLVTAKPNETPELRGQLDSGRVERRKLLYPSLAQERSAVPDDYFSELSVEKVNEGEGWAQTERFVAVTD